MEYCGMTLIVYLNTIDMLGNMIANVDYLNLKNKAHSLKRFECISVLDLRNLTFVYGHNGLRLWKVLKTTQA